MQTEAATAEGQGMTRISQHDSQQEDETDTRIGLRRRKNAPTAKDTTEANGLSGNHCRNIERHQEAQPCNRNPIRGDNDQAGMTQGTNKEVIDKTQDVQIPGEKSTDSDPGPKDQTTKDNKIKKATDHIKTRENRISNNQTRENKLLNSSRKYATSRLEEREIANG